MGPTLIYHFQASRNEEGLFHQASYQVVFFFTSEGPLDEKLLQEKAEMNPLSGKKKLSFLSLDELKEFALRVAYELGEGEVRLISVPDYNIGLDGAKDLGGLREIFTKFGEVMANEEAKKTSKGFLGKIISRLS